MAKKTPAPAPSAENKGKPEPPRLLIKYRAEILPKLAEILGRKNILSLPRLQKIVVNMGVGTATSEKKHLEDAASALTELSGQKAQLTIARKSVAGFRLREGQHIGCMVTLRGPRMYEFLDRLIAIALPRVRDFRGLNPNAFDGRGNFSLGLSELLVFPELNPDQYTRQQGMNITLCVRGARSDDESREMLRLFGIPFRADRPAKKSKETVAAR